MHINNEKIVELTARAGMAAQKAVNAHQGVDLIAVSEALNTIRVLAGASESKIDAYVSILERRIERAEESINKLKVDEVV